jgi:hypothetical protein
MPLHGDETLKLLRTRLLGHLFYLPIKTVAKD